MMHMRLAGDDGMRMRLGATAFVLVLSVLFCQLTVHAQEAQPKSTLNDDLMKTYSYVMLQRLLLGKIEKLHPALADEVQLTRTAWRAAFGEAEDNVEARLASRGGDEWIKSKPVLMARLETAVAGQSVTKELAVNLLETTRERTKGIMDSPVREMLLASHPRFIKTPTMEMMKGYAGQYSTKDHAKARGVHMTIKYPLSWRKETADRPNVVQKWTSDGGHGANSFAIATRRVERESLAELKETLFTEDVAQSMFPEGTKTVRFAVSKLEQQTVGIFEFESTMERLELTLKLRGVMYYFLVDDVLVNVQFTTSNREGGSQEDRFTEMKPLTQLIMQSVVLPDRYR